MFYRQGHGFYIPTALSKQVHMKICQRAGGGEKWHKASSAITFLIGIELIILPWYSQKAITHG